MRSLRWRFLLGSLLWTAGLLMLAHLLSMTLVHHLPGLARMPPGWLVVPAGGLLMAGGFALVRSGLSDVAELRRRLLEVREGRAAAVAGSYPAEVQPLVDDLNGLLAHREETVRRALGRAGDLAHGLKTPLALLAQDGEKAGAEGQAELAAAIADQVEKMRRQLGYHLAQARAAAAGATLGARCDALPVAGGLARTLRKLYAGRRLQLEVEVVAGLAVRVQREDLEEMLGNLLDNACKWATSEVRLEARRDGENAVFEITDDGPGLAEQDRERVLRRGVRADQAAPGTGLGLAIVADLADLYGGHIELRPRSGGGLLARLRLPAAQAATST